MTNKWLEQLYRLDKTLLQVAAYEDHSLRRMSTWDSFDSYVFNPRPQYRGEWLGLQPLIYTEPGLGLSHIP